MNGPWTIKNTAIKYRNPWMEVREDEVIRPDGEDDIYGTVSFPGPGTHVLPMDQDGFVYLIKQFAYGLGVEHITVIAGGVEPNETPLCAAQRELREEAGIKAKIWIPVGLAHPLTSYTRHSHYMFIAQDLAFGGPVTDPNEATQICKFPFADAVDMVMNGTIVSEIASLLILKAHWLTRDQL